MTTERRASHASSVECTSSCIRNRCRAVLCQRRAGPVPPNAPSEFGACSPCQIRLPEGPRKGSGWMFPEQGPQGEAGEPRTTGRLLELPNVALRTHFVQAPRRERRGACTGAGCTKRCSSRRPPSRRRHRAPSPAGNPALAGGVVDLRYRLNPDQRASRPRPDAPPAPA